jgi:hypothetical protein
MNNFADGIGFPLDNSPYWMMREGRDARGRRLRVPRWYLAHIDALSDHLAFLGEDDDIFPPAAVEYNARAWLASRRAKM